MAIEGMKISEATERSILTGNEMIPFADAGKSGKIKSSLLKGQQGDPGSPGENGKTPVFEVGTVTTLNPGTQVSVEVVSAGEDNSGNPKYKINVSIPKGEKGDPGEGIGIPGENGKTPVFEMGNVSTLKPEEPVSAQIVPNGNDESGNPKYKINLSIPKGQQGNPGSPGEPGSPGADGKTPVFETGTATTLESGTQVTVEVVGNGTDGSGNPKYKINVSIPRGEKGEPGEGIGIPGENGKTPVFEAGDVTTLEPGEPVSVQVVPNGEDESGNPKYKINVGIPKGQKGDPGVGSPGSPGADGKTPVLVTGDVTTVEAGGAATFEVVADGNDEQGNPKYKVNAGIPRGDKGKDGASSVPAIDHGTADTTFELTPNVLHRWGEVASLTLTLGAETPGVLNEYMFQFTSGATATQLQLPETVKWNATPEVAANTVYQVSIVDNLAIMGGWANE